MNIVKPYARLVTIEGRSGGMGFTPSLHGFEVEPTLDDGEEALKKIEWCGRISHRSEEKMTEDSWRKFIPAIVMGHGDWSIVEHASATVDMLVDRGITHEVVRHRLFSFTQESTRFVNYEKKMPPSFIEPPGLSDDSLRAGNGEQVESSTRQEWRHAISTCEHAYRALVKISPQIARSVLPNALASRISVTGNFRNWRHFFIMRTTKESHPQMREVTIPLLAEFKEKIPLLYDDIEPLQTQANNLRLPR